MTRIHIDHIRTNGGTQPRESLNQDTVDEYAEAMTEGATFPAVDVYYDGESYWLADGFHRVAAARQIGTVELMVNSHQGTRRDAILHAVGANADHGLRRTNADKRRAVTALLRDEEWSQWSDSEISRRCAVSQPFVGKVREDISHNGYKMQSERKVERNGTEYVQNTTNIGRAFVAVDDAPFTRDEYTHVPDGSWECARCGDVQGPDRTTCSNCHAAKDEKTKTTGDWYEPADDDDSEAAQEEAQPKKGIQDSVETEDPEWSLNAGAISSYKHNLTPAEVARSVVRHFDIFAEDQNVSEQHETANILVKHFRELSIRLNKESIRSDNSRTTSPLEEMETPTEINA